MTGGVEPRKASQSPSLNLEDVKKDISDAPLGQGLLGNDGDASVVKQLPKQDIHQANLPNIKHRKAKLRPRWPRRRKQVDGPDRDISPKDVKFQVPPKRKVEAYSFKMKGALASLGGITGAGIAIGAAAGSVVPVFGTAFGAVVGFVIGGVVGHLVKKYGRSHSHRRYFQNAIKSLEDQGIEFTPREKKRLEAMRPEQWKYLAEKGAPIIKDLRKYSYLRSGSKRWAKQFFYQYAAMTVAKEGYPRAQITLAGLLKSRKRAYKAKEAQDAQQQARDAQQGALALVGDAPNPVPDPVHLVANTMHDELQEFGVDKFHNIKESLPSKLAGSVNRKRDLVIKEWDKVFFAINLEFGPGAADRFEKRYKRHYRAANSPRYVRRAIQNAKKTRIALRAFIGPHIRQYDKDVQSQVLKLVDRYAFDVAIGDVSRKSLLDAHLNFDKDLIEHLIGAAARLQAVKDRSKPQANKNQAITIPDNRVAPDIVLRRATLANRLSSYVDACDGISDKVYARFISGAADIYDECAQLGSLSEEDLARCLRQFDASSKDQARARAEVQAKNLRHIDELAGRLKAGGADRGTARMILRMEARERAFLEVDGGNIEDLEVKPGWSPALNANPEADLPRGELLVRAGDAAAKAERLHEALQDDPDFDYLTQRDAEDIYFQLLGCVRGAGYRDNEILQKLRENDFSSVKEILRSGTDVGAVGIWLHRGARSLKEAIECARLRVDLADVLKVADIDKTELDKWRAKGFTDVEIAAYRNTLMLRKVEESEDVEQDGSPKQKLVDDHFMGIDDERMAFLQGSMLTADEATSLLALGLLRDADSLSAVKLRHHADAHVLSDKHGGDGAFNHVNTRTIRETDGNVDTRVFKRVGLGDNVKLHEHMKRVVGSNLAASMVNEELGFEAIVHTQLSTRRNQIGMSMELAKGYSGARLRSGHDTFVTVPKDVPRYAELHKAVNEDLAEHGAISDETRNWANEKLEFTRLRMVGDELQATGDFLTKLLENPDFREKIGDYEINLFLNNELDGHASNYIIDVQLGPDGVEAAAVKGIDNDGGFGAVEFVPQSLRTMPRVMSRRQADAIKKMYENKDNVRVLNEDGSIKQDDGILKKLSRVVVPSTIHVPVRPDVAFPFEHSRAATAAALGPPEDGNQLKQFEDRLKMLYDAIRQAETGNAPNRPDTYPPLTIITGGAPKNEVKDKAPPKQDEASMKADINPKIESGQDNNNDIVRNDEIKEDIPVNDNKDKDVTWASDDVTKILENTSSIYAREKMQQN